MINKNICLNNFKDISSTGSTWGVLTGITDSLEIVHYNSGVTSEAYLLKLPILISQTIDELGFSISVSEEWKPYGIYNAGDFALYGDNSYTRKSYGKDGAIFNYNLWDITPSGETEQSEIELNGETKISLFRRYGKNSSDPDLYNPTGNTGYTQVITSSDGISRQITGERKNNSGDSNQNLYDYKIWISGETGTTIEYSDIDQTSSVIKYNTPKKQSDNFISAPNTRIDYLNGLVSEPKVNVDVFIDRGINSSFEKCMKLGDIRSFSSLETYGNGFFNIKEN